MLVALIAMILCYCSKVHCEAFRIHCNEKIACYVTMRGEKAESGLKVKEYELLRGTYLGK